MLGLRKKTLATIYLELTELKEHKKEKQMPNKPEPLPQEQFEEIEAQHCREFRERNPEYYNSDFNAESVLGHARLQYGTYYPLPVAVIEKSYLYLKNTGRLEEAPAKGKSEAELRREFEAAKRAAIERSEQAAKDADWRAKCKKMPLKNLKAIATKERIETAQAGGRNPFRDTQPTNI